MIRGEAILLSKGPHRTYKNFLDIFLLAVENHEKVSSKKATLSEFFFKRSLKAVGRFGESIMNLGGLLQ